MVTQRQPAAAITLPAGMNMYLVGRDSVETGGALLTFRAVNPGPGMPSDYPVYLTDAELTTMRTDTLANNQALLKAKLTARYRVNFALGQLDQFMANVDPTTGALSGPKIIL